MARFVRLVRFTAEGMRNIKELPERFAKGRQYLESLGGKIVEVYAVSGPYDLVAILEAPDEKAVMKHGLFVAQTGRSEEHTSELQSHSFISYAVFCLKK